VSDKSNKMGQALSPPPSSESDRKALNLQINRKERGDARKGVGHKRQRVRNLKYVTGTTHTRDVHRAKNFVKARGDGKDDEMAMLRWARDEGERRSFGDDALHVNNICPALITRVRVAGHASCTLLVAVQR
jgi:hypothetical protein